MGRVDSSDIMLHFLGTFNQPVLVNRVLLKTCLVDQKRNGEERDYT
jgi:hypothetical protein